LTWDRLKNDDYWELFLEGMWKYQWTKNYVELTKELKDALYFESQGIIDIAVKIFILAQLRAIATGKERISEKIFEYVARENLTLVKPFLDALKSGDRKLIETYEDIKPIDMSFYFDEYSDKLKERLDKKNERKTNKAANDNSDITEQAILKLLEFGIDEKLARKSVQSVADKRVNLQDITEVAKEAMKYVLGNNTSDEVKKTTRNTKKKPISMDSDDLRLIVNDGKNNKLSAYESLKKKGIIKDPVNEFVMIG